MVFIETDVFTDEITKTLTDEAYRQLQKELIEKPKAGVIIPGSGGLRKLRWAIPGKGKRGGIRLIYYYKVVDTEFYMLYVYKKSKKEDLTKAQVKMLKNVMEEEL